MNIIITSDRHLGKTTLCEKLAKRFKEPGGILCPEDKIINFSGKEMVFCIKEPARNAVKVGHCYIYEDALRFGIEEIKSSKEKDAIFIDEYGPLEWTKRGFYEVLGDVLPTNKCIVIVRKILLEKFLEVFHEHSFKVFELTLENRDSLDKTIYTCMDS